VIYGVKDCRQVKTAETWYKSCCGNHWRY